jgi:hypothetical protein
MSNREQQTARVNVDDATWQAFRIRAIRADRSVADELARLVRNDLRSSAPTTSTAPPGRDTPPGGSPGCAATASARKATSAAPGGRPKQRLADLDVLTELPHNPNPLSRPPYSG